MYLQFETGTKCNAHCSFCPHDILIKRPDIPFEMVTKILMDTKGHMDSVLPFLYQEPLLEPRLVQILRLSKVIHPHAVTAIYSNMSLMTEEKAHELVDCHALDQVFISFYGPNEALYNKYQPGMDWKETKENIRRFIRIAKGVIRITMWYVDIPDLVEHWPAFKAEWGPLVDQVGVVGFESFSGLFPGIKEYYKPVRHPCLRPWQGMNILSDGKVVPCCIDYNGSVVLGNAFEENVMDIWEGEKFEAFRKLHVDGRYDEMPDLCRDCEVWKRT